MSNETRRILLVEDEKAIRDAVTAYLERENYWVTAVGDGQEALEEFSKHHFDLVILDLMLPRVPGERVCRAIRDNSDVPIIMLTAKGEVEDRIIGLELGADDYLVKPFSPRELRGPRPCPAAPRARRQRAAARGAGVRRAHHRRVGPQGARQRRGDRPHGQRVQAAHHAVALPWPRVLAHGAGGEGARLRLRRLRAHHRQPREEPAREDRRQPAQPEVAAHRARRGLPLRRPDQSRSSKHRVERTRA